MNVPAETMREEILQQPAALRLTLEHELAVALELRDAVVRKRPPVIVIAGRGSSDNAALYGRYLLEAMTHIPVSLAAPSLFTLYQAPPGLADAMVIGVSQSGESADVREVVREARRQGALTVAITNEESSPLGGEAEFVLVGRGGREMSVPATKSYTSQLGLFALLGCVLSQGAGDLDALQATPEAINRVLGCEERIREAAERYRNIERCIVLGRGYNLSSALELALKIKETSYVLAQPYSQADFLHGPVALIEQGFPAILVAPSGVALPGFREISIRLRQAGAEMLAFSDDPALLASTQTPVHLPPAPSEALSPISYTVAGQLLAYHLARARRLDPSNPRGLMKVTITR